MTQPTPRPQLAAPSVEDIASAYEYITREFMISDGFIHSEMWAEGLAFGSCRPSADDLRVAAEALPQLTTEQWILIAHHAQRMRLTGGFAGMRGAA